MFQIATTLAYAWDNGCEASFPTIKQATGGEENFRHVFHRLNTEPFPEGTEFELYNEVQEKVYTPIPYQQNRNLCFNGFFQTEKYFSKHIALLRQLFAPTAEILQEIDQKFGHLFTAPTVAVHVRTFIPDGWDPLTMIRPGYYLMAMAQFPDNCHFLIFSDDMEWTKKHIHRGKRKITFIEGNPRHLDFYLMSLCDHQIVSAFSSFSWWAAWLNPNPHKIVIATDPAKWTRTKSDFIPTTWKNY